MNYSLIFLSAAQRQKKSRRTAALLTRLIFSCGGFGNRAAASPRYNQADASRNLLASSAMMALMSTHL